MKFKIRDVRTFIGAKDFDQSRRFYTELGYTEISIDPKMSLFKLNEDFGFYLQDYYVKDWINNSMVFVEVDDVDLCEKELLAKGLHQTYKHVRISEIKTFDHGRQVFMHDPSGVLWHFCQFFVRN